MLNAERWWTFLPELIAGNRVLQTEKVIVIN
jgi:hypothetical protein